MKSLLLCRESKIKYSLICAIQLLLLVASISVSAQVDDKVSTIKVSTIKESVNLRDRVKVTYAAENTLLSEIVEMNDWNTTFSPSPFPVNKAMWVKLSVVNDLGTPVDLSLITRSAFIDRTDSFLLDELGRIIQSNQQNSADNNAPINLHGFKMRFIARPNQALNLYLRIKDDGPAIFPLELWRSEVLQDQEQGRLILIGALSGGLSLLSMYFLFSYMVRNQVTRFWFSIFSVGTMTALLSIEGILPKLFNLPTFAADITIIALSITLFASVKIGRAVFEPVSKLWLRAHYIFILFPVISLFFVSDYIQLIVLTAVILLFMLSKFTAALIYRVKLDMISASIYLAGWILLIAVVGLEVNTFLTGNSHLFYSAPLPFAFTCIGVMLIGLAIMNKEQSIAIGRHRRQKEQLAGLKDYQDLFRHAAEGLYTATTNGKLINANPALCALFGYQNEQDLLASRSTLASLFVNTKDADSLLGSLHIDPTILGKEMKGRRKDGTEFWFSISCQNSRVSNQLLHFGSLYDITERRLSQLNLKYLNTHDQLTGLYNRRHFSVLLNEAIANATSSDVPFALLYIDVDQFKVINDTCGHTAGDVFIKELSQELFDVLQEEHVFARLSADEFGLIIPYTEQKSVKTTTQKLLTQVREFQFKWGKYRFTQSVSVGIAYWTPSIVSAEIMLSMADTACIVAKENGRDNVHTYSSNQNIHASYERELHWVNEVTEALEDDRLVLYYQHYRPLNSAINGDFYEILVRLKDSNGEIIAPETFMPAAERYNLSNKVDRWVIEHYFQWLSSHKKHVSQLVKCNINLTGPSLAESDFRFFLLNAFEKYNIPHRLICFEVTETMAIIKMSDTIAFINEFKRLGCTFALDDFGSGFSSYGYLKNLPVDFVKIDGNFVRDILNDPIDMAMVTSIKDVAVAMNIKTVAEFVETEEIMVQLGKMGVDFAQGFAIAKPHPIEHFESYKNSSKL